MTSYLDTNTRTDFIFTQTEAEVLKDIINDHLGVFEDMPKPLTDRQNLEARVLVNILKKMEQS